MCLLNVLIDLKKELNFEIVVAHINHMIREEAEMETEYVQNFCKLKQIERFVKRAFTTRTTHMDSISRLPTLKTEAVPIK